MVSHRRDFKKGKTIQFFVFVVIILLIILAVFFVCRYFIFNKTTSGYLVKNKYYSFKLATPKNWIAEKNMFYSEDNIAQLLEQCKNDNSKESSVYEVGAFRFEDQKYPENLNTLKSLPAGLSSGAILEVTVNCIPGEAKDKIINYGSASLKTGGEKTFELFFNSPGFGNVKYLSFFHNGLQYKINEYVYVSSGDKAKDKDIRTEYAKTFNEIVSSFEFK